MRNREMESSLEKIQSIYSDESQALRKKLESKKTKISASYQKQSKILVIKQYNLTHCQSRNFTQKMTQRIPLLQKKPSQIIVHVGINDTCHSTSGEILKKLSNSKSFIQEKLIGCKVYISTPTLPSDNGKATLAVNQLTNHLLYWIY